MKNLLMTIWTLLTTSIYTVVFGIPAIIFAVIDRRGVITYRIGQAWAWLILKTNGVKLHVDGLDNVKKRQSYIFYSNHQSHLDGLAVGLTLPYPLRFVVKKSLLKLPIIGLAIRLGRMIVIDRSNKKGSIEAINRSAEDLKNGISALFFGEGTRSSNGKLLPFKKGGIAFSISMKLPIIPITVIDSRKLLPKESLYIRSGRMRIVIGKAILTTDYSKNDIDLLLKRVRLIISENLEKYGESKEIK